MFQWFLRKSLQTQLVCLALFCAAAIALVSLIVVNQGTWGLGPLSGSDAHVLRLRLLAVIGITAILCITTAHFAIGRLLRPLYRIRDTMWQVSQGRIDTTNFATYAPASTPDVLGFRYAFDRMLEQLRRTSEAHEQSKASLAQRTRTVDRLLEFSQSIQGAGRADQIFATLCHFLQAELGLAGAAILSFQPDASPATQLRAAYPADLFKSEPPVGEMELDLCPCHRQQLPRHFRPDGSPVRCSLDASLRLGPSHPAYCIPFTLGGKTPAVVHMLMPENRPWTEENRQLAQTYVNTTQSALISLHLLAEAEKQSMTDALTGLYNRRSFDSLMQREVALAERHHHPLSLVMIDMDRFKHINDTHGHAAGDHLLRSFADCVRITLRKTDLAFRHGGDEFVIALPQTPLSQAEQVVQKLRQAFSTVDFSSAITKLDQQPTLSIGVAERSAANNVLTLSSLLSAADQALYEAKSNNRNCVKIYQPVKAA